MKKDAKSHHQAKEIDGRPLKPESLMMTYGYRPEWSEGALKCPIFQTSTFVFESAEKGKAFFEMAYGLRNGDGKEQLGLIYSRLNNPDLEILEDRLTLWDGAEDAASFESGMAAISTCLMTFLRPGDLLLYGEPVYGGTDHFIQHILTRYGIQVLGFDALSTPEEVEQLLKASGHADRLRMIFVETPTNPTNALVDIAETKALAMRYSTKDRQVIFAVDNTFLGPLWQQPLKHGADIVIYSATKFIGGHSDVIAGACLGSDQLVQEIKGTRSFFGTMAGPWTGWLLMRSLETVKVRMTQQTENAKVVAQFLCNHPKVEKVHYLGHLKEGTRQYGIYKKQCLAPGSMIAFDVKNGLEGAFRFLNNIKIAKLAVSLGGTETLAEHPASMTHSDIPVEEQRKIGITDSMVRISVGVENADDLVAAMDHALKYV